MPSYNYEFLIVENIGDFVVHVKLNRPNKLNAINDKLWTEIVDVFTKLDEDEDCRVVIMSGEGRAFTTGMDVASEQDEWIERFNIESGEIARPARRLRRKLVAMQACFTRIDKCTKPVIAAIHGFCFTDGMAVISACDIRHCTYDAQFAINELESGVAPDMGTLNRMPKVLGNGSWLREIALSARRVGAEEALKFGLVSTIYENKPAMMEGVTALARTIAMKSPVAVQGSKITLNYSRDHTVDDSLNFGATWSKSQLFTEDIPKAASALMTKGPTPQFSKL